MVPHLSDLKFPFLKIAASLLFFSSCTFAQGTWSMVSSFAPSPSGGGILLLSDGSVMAKNTAGPDTYGSGWNKLTPNANGSYVNGTWSTLPSMANTRLYFSTQVLKDGRVYVAGGEYGTGKSAAEMYDPVSNAWTNLPSPGGIVSDANSEILPDGRVIQAMVNGTLKTTLIYNPSNNTYIPGPTCIGIHNESAWVKLQDNSILFVDRLSTNSERYIPSLNTWTADATVPVNLYDPFGDETGGAILLPDGRAFFMGSIGNTAIYTPSGNNSPGAWVAGPTIPNNNGATDAMMAIMPNGKVLCVVSPTPISSNHFPSPTYFYEYDYVANSFAQVNAPISTTSLSAPAYVFNLLNLPSGQILLSRQGSSAYYIYTPTGTPLANGQPTASTIIQSGCNNFTLTGMLFNGISEGSVYGDDWQNATNYPIIQLKNGSNVYYARTFNWNRTGVRTGNLADTVQFSLPPSLPHLTYSLCVVVNGISSSPIMFTPYPILTSSNTPGPICTGSAFTYTATSPVSGCSFSWTRAAVAGLSNPAIVTQQTVNINEVLNNTTVNPVNVIYTYSIAAPSGCTDTQTISALVNPLPTVSIAGTNSICSGDNIILTASGATSYTWNTSATTSTVQVAPMSSTIYSVSGSDANGCFNSAQFSVDVTATPTLSITGGTSICQGETALLTASGGTNYSWSNSATTNSIIAGPTVTTTYSVSSTNGNCTAVDSVQVIVNDCTGINAHDRSAQNIVCYPNPVNGILHIEIKEANVGELNYSFINILGQEVLTHKVETNGKSGTINVNTSVLDRGIYTLRIKGAGIDHLTRIVVY